MHERKTITMSRKLFREAGLLLGAVLITLLTDFIFFKSLWGLFPSLFMGIDFYQNLKLQTKEWKIGRKRSEFRQMLRYLNGALGAGHSLESAFKETEQELRLMYRENTDQVQALLKLNRRLDLKEPLSHAFLEYAKSTELEEAMDFSEVLELVSGKGGNIAKVIEDTIFRITDSMELKEEVETMILSKRLELTIMILMPMMMTLYLRMTNASYVAPLFETSAGYFVMAAAVIFTAVADTLGRKIIYGKSIVHEKNSKKDRREHTGFLQRKDKTKP